MYDSPKELLHAVLCEAVSQVRAYVDKPKALSAGWKKDIEKDYVKRHKGRK